MFIVIGNPLLILDTNHAHPAGKGFSLDVLDRRLAEISQEIAVHISA
jgi:hypothetical protein